MLKACNLNSSKKSFDHEERQMINPDVRYVRSDIIYLHEIDICQIAKKKRNQVTGSNCRLTHLLPNQKQVFK